MRDEHCISSSRYRAYILLPKHYFLFLSLRYFIPPYFA